jgi:6-phosphogluconolactonase (cycloisomerase 2 family)
LGQDPVLNDQVQRLTKVETIMLNTARTTVGLLLLASTAALADQPDLGLDRDVTIVAASNTAANQLLFYSASGSLLKTVSTQGQGGVSGNAGGIATQGDRLAVVNFGSGNVSVFARDADGRFYHFENVVPALGAPVSVAFGHNHLYILTTTHVESHAASRLSVAGTPDGTAALLKADGTAAQVGVIDNQLIFSEKSGAIETVNLDGRGAVAGKAAGVSNYPANANTPFGLATRGNDAYVTIAHSNEISLVRNDAILTLTGSGTQNAPCWLALDGPFLFSANSPSESVSRYVVYGQTIVQEAAVVAQFNGNPTDIAYRHGVAGVIDANGSVSHVSIYKVDGDGNFSLNAVATINNVATNGIAVLAND